ncbi:MAG: hypothetical protein V2A73_03500 [Pseudomonadota bacterium]
MNRLDFDHFPEELRARVPGFAQVYEEHIRDYDEVLPHVLLGELVRFLADEIRSHGQQSTALCEAMELLERGMGSLDSRLQELIAVSFLENLEPQDEAFATISSMFGPRLREQYQRFQNG